MKTTIPTSIENGRFKRNRPRVLELIKSFEGKPVEITLAKPRKTRSDNQNRYYWGVIIPLIKDAIRDTWGDIFSKEKTHEFLKDQFLFTEKVNEETGELAKIPKSTTECTTTEIEEYYEQCRRFSEEWFNTIVPLPGEQLTIG